MNKKAKKQLQKALKHLGKYRTEVWKANLKSSNRACSTLNMGRRMGNTEWVVRQAVKIMAKEQESVLIVCRNKQHERYIMDRVLRRCEAKEIDYRLAKYMNRIEAEGEINSGIYFTTITGGASVSSSLRGINIQHVFFDVDNGISTSEANKFVSELGLPVKSVSFC